MKPLRKVTGRVAVIDRPDVDTDQIIPKQFLKRIERTGYGEFLFNDWRYDEDGNERPGFELNRPEFRGASSSSRDATSAAARRASTRRGRCRTTASTPSSRRRSATSSARTAGKNGLLAIVLPEDEVDRLMESVDLDTGSEMTVDLERCVIVAPDGREVPFEFDEATRHRILEGLDDIALTLQHEDAIAAYETAHGIA